jgi:signal peptidase I
MTEDNPADVGPKPTAARSTADVPETPPAESSLTDRTRAEHPGPDQSAAEHPASRVDSSPNGAAPRADGPRTEDARSDLPGAEPVGEPSGPTGPTGPAGAAAKPAKPEKKKGSFLKELPILLAIALVLAVIIKSFLVQAFFIPSSSMEKTLHGCAGCSGDRVLVNKLTYRFHDPRPGDIVVFRGPESWAPEVRIAGPNNILQRGLRSIGQLIGIAQPSEKDFIKRVIAVGGQTVQCCDPQGRVMVDGKPLDEPYIFMDGDQDPRLAQFGPITVPPGRLWVMGDHRNASADSRAHISDANLGTISVDDVIGKAFIIVWPPSRWDTLGTPSTFKSLGPVQQIATGSFPLLLSLGMVLPLGAVRRRRTRPGDPRPHRGRPGRPTARRGRAPSRLADRRKAPPDDPVR